MAKRQNEFHSIKDLMKDVIKENKLTKGMLQLSVKEAWAKLMGVGVVSYTNNIELHGKTLIVNLKSSVLREELSYGKEKIISMMNDELGGDLISKLILS
ncbi:Zn-ribbon-containing, possibly RNA-binding protein and truncated derivatives [hydrothermal vent metagenome]|uniref:Zn-ribbon-containing, possibly RNA-binding protein and truncated derivatives n=1 Tax=hydrothermal vent metagenome TaxID=652676 RepID=A0A3B0UED0_9ZZZZ